MSEQKFNPCGRQVYDRANDGSEWLTACGPDRRCPHCQRIAELEAERDTAKTSYRILLRDERELVKKLIESSGLLSRVIPDCHNLHHGSDDMHTGTAECPVEKRIEAWRAAREATDDE